jgi:hypothetical protein
MARQLFALWAAALCLAVTAHAAAPTLSGLCLQAWQDEDGRPVLRCEVVPGPDIAKADPSGFSILRIAESGMKESYRPSAGSLSRESGRMGGFTWSDPNTGPGRTYVYYAQYAADVQLCSNPVVVSLRERGVGHGAQQRRNDPSLNIDVVGPPYVGPGDFVVAVARPSIPGGTWRWDCLTPSHGQILATRGDRALLFVGSEIQPVGFEVTYSVDGRSVSQVYMPRIFWFRIVSSMGTVVHVRSDLFRPMTDRERAQLVAELMSAANRGRLAAQVMLAFGEPTTPDLLSSEARARISEARGVVIDVGAPALPSLLALFARSQSVEGRADLASAICAIDPASAVVEFVPELIARDEYLPLAAAARMLMAKRTPEPFQRDLQRAMTAALASASADIRMLACDTIRTGDAQAAERLEDLIAHDPHPLVRHTAAAALLVLEGGQVDDALPPRTQSCVEDDEVKDAQRLLPGFLAEARVKPFPPTHDMADTWRLAILGSSALPAVCEHLLGPDCDLGCAEGVSWYFRTSGLDFPHRAMGRLVTRCQDAQIPARAAAFAQYARIVGAVDTCWKSLDLTKPWAAQEIEYLSGGDAIDQCYLAAGVSVRLNALSAWVASKPAKPAGFASLFGLAYQDRLRYDDNLVQIRKARELLDRLGKNTGMIGELVRAHLVPPRAPGAGD